MKWKSRGFVILTCICLMMVHAGAAEAADSQLIMPAENVDIIYEGKICDFDAPVISTKDGWLLPLRPVLGEMGISAQGIVWRENGRVTIKAAEGLPEVVLEIGNEEIQLDGQTVVLNGAPVLYQGSVYVPLDFFEAAYHKKVLWDTEVGRAYLQDWDTYETVYRTLNRAHIVDPETANEIEFHYRNDTEEIDADNGQRLMYTKQEGTATYDMETGECLDVGADTRMDREIPYKNQYQDGVLELERWDGITRTSNQDEIDIFLNSMLSNVNLSLDTINQPLKPVEDEMPEGIERELSYLDKLAAVLQIEEVDGNTIKISGSTLALQPGEYGVEQISAQEEYVVDLKTDKLLSKKYHYVKEREYARFTARLISRLEYEFNVS